jgi:hypothetical protein
MRQHERGRDGAVRARLLVRIVQQTALLVGVVATTLLGVRIYDVQRGPPVGVKGLRSHSGPCRLRGRSMDRLIMALASGAPHVIRAVWKADAQAASG